MYSILRIVVVWFCIVTAHAAEFSDKKVLHINAYHQGYAWSDGIEEGVKLILEPKGVEVKFHRMDTKHHNNPDFLTAAGLKAKAKIEAFQPDVVIVADDNAVKHVLMTHYRDAAQPFVFCGVNWDASIYGLPYKNTTGMVEVGMELGAIRRLKNFAKGDRVGLLASNTITNRKNYQYHTSILGIQYHQVYLVNNFQEWKNAFLTAQQETDLLIMPEYASMLDWNQQEAEAFVLENTRIPAAAMQEEIASLALIGIVKVPKEQGIWAARTTLKILSGIPPKNIPMTRNRLNRIHHNQQLAKHLNIQFN